MKPAELFALAQSHQLPHALLFSGGVLSEKREFALNLAKEILGHKFMEDYSHPDLYYLEDSITIDQIREISAKLHQTAHQGKYKIVILGLAESMPVGAMNALLKTLEEPPPYSLIILITEFSSLLPLTIRSRCQKVFFNALASATERNLNNTELDSELIKLLQSSQNPSEMAVNFEKKSSSEILEILNKLYFIAFAEIKKNNNKKLFLWLDELNKAREKLLKKHNPNIILLFENLFYQWKRIWIS